MTNELRAATQTSRRVRRGWRALVGILFLAIFCTIWVGRGALFRGVAEFWVVSDPVGPADAVAIFGGGLGTRPFAAAEYYKEGLTKEVLLSSVRLDESEKMGDLPSHTELNRRILLKLGVPETAIRIFGDELSNTYQEAVALRAWAVSTSAHSVIVPTEEFESRRVRWIVRRELAGTGTRVQVPALQNSAYSKSNWWENEKAIMAFQNEMLKYVYYRFKY